MSDTESSSTSILRPINNRDDDTDNDAEIEERPTKKIRKANRSYVHHDDFQTYKEAIDLVLDNFDDNSWAAKEKRETQQGEKHFYKCSSCEKRLYILKPLTHSGASIFVEDVAHVHQEKSRGIPEKTKEIIIKKYFEQSIKPKEIMRWLRDNIENGYVEVNSVQLNNLIQCHKKNNDELKQMNFNDLKTWVESRNQVPDL